MGDIMQNGGFTQRDLTDLLQNTSKSKKEGQTPKNNNLLSINLGQLNTRPPAEEVALPDFHKVQAARSPSSADNSARSKRSEQHLEPHAHKQQLLVEHQ